MNNVYSIIIVRIEIEAILIWYNSPFMGLRRLCRYANKLVLGFECSYNLVKLSESLLIRFDTFGKG
jgi:hypothetical protein